MTNQWKHIYWWRISYKYDEKSITEFVKRITEVGYNATYTRGG